MNNLTNKEKNLNSLLEKLSNLSKSYTHDSTISEKLKMERENFLNEKIELDTNYNKLLREHKYLKDKIANLEEELSKKTELQEKFGREIDELSQETEQLVEEIDKWQT